MICPTFDKVKNAYFSGLDWHRRKLTFGTCTIAQIVATLQAFQPYLLQAYDCFFIENERGAALITCINETGIRAEYFDGPGVNDYEWLHFYTGEQICGDADAPRTMIKQPDRFA